MVISRTRPITTSRPVVFGPGDAGAAAVALAGADRSKPQGNKHRSRLRKKVSL